MVQSTTAGKTAESENSPDYVLNVLDQVLPPVDGDDEPKARIPTPNTIEENLQTVININGNGEF